MLQAFVITLREGLEAFLIVAISLAYLRKTGRAGLLPAVHWGIAASIAMSIGAGLMLARARNQALWEGLLAFVAAVSVATLIVHMWRTGKKLRRAIEGRLEHSAMKSGTAAFLGVFTFTVLMITREGMETALLMNALVNMESTRLIAGAMAGTLVAAFVAFLWSRYGHRVNLARFFQVTAVFLAVFVVQLVVYGFHELTEANIGIPNADWWHWKTEPFGPDGAYGQYLTYGLVALPMMWLAISALFSRERRGGSPQPA